jgi:glycosyltransferase involved in cell wall biosynthesis
MKILHIIIGLNVGGAEIMLKRLVQSSLGNKGLANEVVSLTQLGVIGIQLENMGVRVTVLNIKSIFSAPYAFFKLVKIIKNSKPSIVQTWMYHADLLGGLASFFAGNRNIAWNIRGSSIPQQSLSLTGVLTKLCAILSHKLPKKIICCAEAARSSHVIKGYAQSKMVVINNGYDMGDYHAREARESGRLNLGISEDTIVIGIVGRFDVLKDYNNFISAANELLKEFSNIKFLMVGKGLDNENHELTKMVKNDNTLDSFLLMGERNNVNKYLAVMDIYCMSSSKEGFPNVVCEAMAMQIPCVVTDAGDAKNIVGDTGIVVPIKDSSALALGLKTMISYDVEKKLKLGKLARERINRNYSIEKALNQYEELYREIVK